MKAMVVGLAAAAMLSGCAMGIQPGGESPHVTYTVPRDYRTVVLRAQNQASECLRGKNQYDVYADVDPALGTAVVSVKGPISGFEVARTEIKSLDPRRTQVTQTVWGPKPWDAHALDAMRESIRLDTSVCAAYR